MDMHEASDHDVFDTLSLSDLHIYSDPSCSSHSQEDEQDYGGSFSSFRFKVAGFQPAEEIVTIRNLKSLPENDLNPRHKPQKPSRLMTTFPVQDGGGKVVKLAPVVRPRRRRKRGRGFLMFGLGGSPARMEMFDVRSMQARPSPTRIVPVDGGGVEEATLRRKSGNWLGKLVGACIPTV